MPLYLSIAPLVVGDTFNQPLASDSKQKPYPASLILDNICEKSASG